MTVNFYKNSSPVNYITKNITSNGSSIECELKDNCNIMEPIIEVIGTNALSSNYMWIPLFNRYYFITEITTTIYNTLIIKGRVDVLMSFKTDILNSYGIIARNEQMYNRYIADSKYTTLSYERVQTKAFPNEFPTNGNFVLIVTGGA